MKIDAAHATISPSMDIQVSSNFERYLFDLLGRDAKKLYAVMDEFKATGRFALDATLMEKARQDFQAYRCGEDETLATMKKIHAETGYTLDPHSAVGVSAALKMPRSSDYPVISLATAHPAKFPDAVEKATGVKPDLPEHLQGLMEKKEIFMTEPNDLAAIKNLIRH